MNADERRWGATVLGTAVLLMAWALPVSAATPVPSGKWSFVFTDKQGLPDRPIRVYTYRPRQCESTCPMLIALHGKNRRASAMRDNFELAADRHGFLVVAPEFSEKHWPKAADYNLGRVADEKDRRLWTYSVIERLFDEMRDGQKDYRLFGHSAGAQFVHRMALLMPENRASVVVAANAGWYLMPEWRKDKDAFKYPHSLVGSPGGEGELRTALGRRLVVLLGEQDTKTDDPDLDKSEGSMKQGANRFERGEAFFAAATGAARDLGAKLAWELAYVPGAGHDASKMARAAADHLAGTKK